MTAWTAFWLMCAAFNVAQTALNTVRDYRVLQAVAATLRSQAHMIDLMAGGVKQ